MAIGITLIVVLEVLYFFFFSMVGGEVTDDEDQNKKNMKKRIEQSQASQASTQDKSKEKNVLKGKGGGPGNSKSGVGKNGKPESDPINEKNFYLRRADFSMLIPKSLVRKSSMFSSNDPNKSKEFYLYHNNICAEIDGHYSNRTFYESFMSRMYIVFATLRLIVLIVLIVFLDY